MAYDKEKSRLYKIQNKERISLYRIEYLRIKHLKKKGLWKPLKTIQFDKKSEFYMDFHRF